jgi:hypothetical protein
LIARAESDADLEQVRKTSGLSTEAHLPRAGHDAGPTTVSRLLEVMSAATDEQTVAA